MSKKNEAPKIGQIRLTDSQKAIVAQGVDTEFFQVIAKVIRPKRQTQVAVTSLNVAQSESDLFFYKGKSAEMDWLVKELVKIADDYNKKQDEEEG